jgi:hypothetical protein
MNINGCLLKNVDGDIYKFGKFRHTSKEETWFMLPGNIKPDGRIQIKINGKKYYKHRLLYKLSHPDWDIENSGPNNTIDHIDIDCKNNSLNNLRTATALQQVLNRKCVINAKGYTWNKRYQKWEAQIQIDGKKKHLGYFVLEVDARQAYLTAVEINRALLFLQ